MHTMYYNMLHLIFHIIHIMLYCEYVKQKYDTLYIIESLNICYA